jgi:ribA/ribD-fused uncharacterized protein
MNHASNIRSADELAAQVRRGWTPRYLFFWGHRPGKGGAVGKETFSQWFCAPFTIDHVRYPSAEHFMMAEKARLFGDEGTRQHILNAASPEQAKALGRQVAGFNDARWEAARFDIVVQANRAKFMQNEPLGAFLLSTGNRILVEASPVDRIWGIGLAADDPRASQPDQWRGLNLLGFALMVVRSEMEASGGSATA